MSGGYISSLGRNAARHVRTIVSRELASLTLGDAGSAVLLERAEDGTPGISLTGFTTVAHHSRLCLAYPAHHEPGARMFTKSQALQRAGIADVPVLLEEALEALGLTLGAPRNPAVVTVDRYGTTASTTHFVALAEELASGRTRVGDQVAIVALASGLEIGIVLFTVDGRLVRSYGHHD